LIACLDVDYRQTGARAACVAFAAWTDDAPLLTEIADVPDVQPYQPGNFYLRELPCLLAVLERSPRLPETLIVDGHVWLSADGAPGLGARLHEAIGRQSAVIGVGKTLFRGLDGSPLLSLVHRGSSKAPLYITAVGVDLATAADSVRAMHGAHRIPTLLRLVDRLARSGSNSSSP
jgi:deoxyribonuclease V